MNDLAYEFYHSSVHSHCRLPCSKSKVPCPPGAKWADVIEHLTVSLPSGIPAYQDLIRLIAYNQYGVSMPQTMFSIIENDRSVSFGIDTREGRGIVFTLTPLKEKEQYRIKVRAKSYDKRRRSIRYKTTFIIFISVSLFPY